MKYKNALLIGRFQPFHLGHLYLVNKALEVAEKVTIGIGSANIYDSNNPLDSKTREKILKSVFYKEGVGSKVTKIVHLDDFFNDEKWFTNVKAKAGAFDLVVGNNDWVNRIMKKGGYEVLRVPYYKRFLYEGEKIRKLLVEDGNWQERVPQYLVKFIRENLTASYDKVVLGGTFDRFHKGHRAMLNRAFTIGQKVTVGVATVELHKKKFLADRIETLSVRKKSVRDYLSEMGWLKRAKIITFGNFKGPLDRKKDVDAIVVSRQTLPNALRINRLRLENKLQPLRTIAIEDVLSTDGRLISSERIRRGEIDRNGKLYLNNFADILSLPEEIREELRKPLGKVIKGSHRDEERVSRKIISIIKDTKPTLTIAVGDIIANSMEKYGLTPDIKVVDFKSRRVVIPVQKNKNTEAIHEHVNDPGTINPKSVIGINKAIAKFLTYYEPQTVKVRGEEDLLTLPAVMLAPLGSLVLYGHWQLGVIAVEVSEMEKTKIIELLKKFK
jgi:pantetheine-phosphate adenylyltransferase